MESWLALAVVVALTAWQNLLQVAPAHRRDLVVSVGVLVAAGIGATWLFTSVDPMAGLGPAVPWTIAALAVTAGVVIAARRRPRLASSLRDRRIGAMSGRTFWVHVLVRIPVLTALVEEVVFRGVAWRLLDGVGGLPTAWVGSSVAFGIGHVAVARAQALREGRPVVSWVVATVAATTVAGLALGGLRWVTGGIWAGVGVHAVVNATLAVGARRAATDLPDAA